MYQTDIILYCAASFTNALPFDFWGTQKHHLMKCSTENAYLEVSLHIPLNKMTIDSILCTHHSQSAVSLQNTEVLLIWTESRKKLQRWIYLMEAQLPCFDGQLFSFYCYDNLKWIKMTTINNYTTNTCCYFHPDIDKLIHLKNKIISIGTNSSLCITICWAIVILQKFKYANITSQLECS